MLTQQQILHQTTTPWLLQSLRILQAPALELRRLITEELATNPTLEETDHPDSLSTFDTLDFSVAGPPFSDTPDTLISAQNQLLDQLEASHDPIATKIIGNLDDSGYFCGDLATIARETNHPLAEIEKTLRHLQATLDPAGIAARNLSECLLLQLERLGRSDTLATRIVRDHLDLVAQHKTRQLAHLLDTNEKAITAAIIEIRSLNPRPGAALATTANPAIHPDIIIERDDSGKYRARLDDRALPRLRIADTYKDMLATRDQPREVLAFLRSRIRSANAFIKTIEQRNLTLLAIAETLISRQPAFLENGLPALTPMTLSHIARTLDIHETTVSRAISGKYVATPHGLFALKDLFRTKLATRDGGEIADTAVREAITEIIRTETKPLSDTAIAEALAQRGIAIARRTVAKYRAQLGILPKHLRDRG